LFFSSITCISSRGCCIYRVESLNLSGGTLEVWPPIGSFLVGCRDPEGIEHIKHSSRFLIFIKYKFAFQKKLWTYEVIT
jgi:hypothetical protein